MLYSSDKPYITAFGTRDLWHSHFGGVKGQAGHLVSETARQTALLVTQRRSLFRSFLLHTSSLIYYFLHFLSFLSLYLCIQFYWSNFPPSLPLRSSFILYFFLLSSLFVSVPFTALSSLFSSFNSFPPFCWFLPFFCFYIHLFSTFPLISHFFTYFLSLPFSYLSASLLFCLSFSVSHILLNHFSFHSYRFSHLNSSKINLF
jgi:hypothetical protein